MERITLRLTNILEGWHEVEGIDQEATCLAYAQVLGELLQREYPDAEIEVTCDHRTCGASSTHIDGTFEEEQEFTDVLSRLSDQLLNDSESWVVMETWEAWLGDIRMGQGTTREKAIEAAVREYEAQIGYGDEPHRFRDRDSLAERLSVSLMGS